MRCQGFCQLGFGRVWGVWLGLADARRGARSGAEAAGEAAEVLIPKFEDIGKQKKRDQGKLTMGFAFLRFDTAAAADSAAAAFQDASVARWGRAVKTSRDMAALKRRASLEEAPAATLSAEAEALTLKRRAHKVNEVLMWPEAVSKLRRRTGELAPGRRTL